MITVTRLGAGVRIAVNPDLIERVDETPDSVITLVDGHKLVVQEALDEIIDRVRSWRASVAAEAIAVHRQADVEDDAAPDSESSTAAQADRATGQSAGARILRLRAREV